MTSLFKKWAAAVVLCFFVALIFTAKATALEKRTSYALSHYIMGLMHNKLGDTDKAIEEYKKALKADYKNAVIHLNLASSYIQKNDTPRAIEELNLAIKFDPEAAEPHAILALLYSLQNKLDAATQEYEIALQNASRTQPNNIEIYRSLGAIYLQQKKFQLAQQVYNSMLGLSPKDPQAHFYLSIAYDEMKDRTKAEEELKKAIELKSDYHEALNYLGYMYVEEEKNLDAAEVMIKKALEIEPNNGAYIDSLGWLYFKKGKLSPALEQLERASALLEDPVIYDHLGDVYLKKGDVKKALGSWQKSLQLDSKQEQIKKKIDALHTKSN